MTKIMIPPFKLVPEPLNDEAVKLPKKHPV